MYIDRLYIRDFGIFNDALLDNLSPEIVIIGGKNRAGKTTLFNVLKNISYGFLKGDNLPDAKFKYYVEAAIKDKLDIYNIKVEGYKNPYIEENTKTDSLYGIDRYTYQQLFCISLKELNQILGEDEKLQSVLLGAGLNDVVKLPAIISELRKDAEKVGGKQGNPDTKMFKAYSKNIKELALLRDNILKERQEFLKLKSKLTEVSSNILEKKSIIKLLKRDIKVISLIKNTYEDYIKFKELNNILNNEENVFIINKYKKYSLDRVESLKNDYISITEEYEKINDTFKSIEESIDKKSLIKNIKFIKYYFKELSGLREKYTNYILIKSSNSKEKNSIIAEINNLNPNLKGNIEGIMSINCNFLSINKLAANIDESITLETTYNNLTKEINNLKYEKQLLLYKNGNHNIELNNMDKILFLLILFIWLCLTLINTYKFGGKFKYIYMIFTLFIMGYICYFIISNLKLKTSNIVKTINNIDRSIREKETEFSKINNKKNKIEKIFSVYKENLKLDKNFTKEGIIRYLESVQGVQKSITTFNYNISRENDIKSDLDIVINQIGSVLDKIYKNKNFIKSLSYDKLFNELEKLTVYSKIAEKYNSCLFKKEKIEKVIKEYLYLEHTVDIKTIYEYIDNIQIYTNLNEIRLNKEKLSYSLKNNFKSEIGRESIKGKDTYTEIEKIFSRYTDISEINSEYENLKYRLDTSEEKLKFLEERSQEIKYKLNTMENSKRLETIQKDIIENRKDLKPLAERYAVSKVAAFILENVYEDFINRAQNTILQSSSEIFSYITNGEYSKILPSNDLREMDFKTLLSNGTINESSITLSTATKEQLFLAVRLSRIKDIKPLPIVLDDSLVNFDIMHLKATINIIKELSKRNQIFIFTCHGELVELMHCESCNVQYWKVDNGKFILSNRRELSNYLS
ncbi:AAA family ATPase [Clostridium rectalis]|uniref:AAA family ATPase n=1 Tax=Clostridium rectalis TaxID=2040295 RepID=UPI000F643D72|nr:AAA family ATPase [Clostridium rectalis]